MPHPFQTPRWANMVRRMIGDRGYLGLQVIEDVQPGIELNDSGRPDHAALREERLKVAYTTLAAIAGQLNSIALGNPVGSGLVKVVRRLHTVQAGAAMNCYLGLRRFSGLGAAQSIGIAKYRDARLSTPLAAANVPTDNDGSLASYTTLAANPFLSAAGSEPSEILVVNTSIQRVEVEYVVTPGWCLMLEGATANTTLTCGMEWFEYVASAEELLGGS